VDLRGFERGARASFSFPSSRRLALITAVAALFAACAGCPPLFLFYASAALPLTLRVAAPRFITLRRAYGLVPLFLLWCSLVSTLRPRNPLIFVPPSLLMLLPLRFFASARWRMYLPAALALAIVASQGSLLHLALAAALTGVAVAIVEAYVLHARKTLAPYGGLELVTAYLSYALTRDKGALERVLLKLSRERRVPVYALDLFDERGAWGTVVVPHVHPGPFRDIGSSRLPSLVVEAARKRGLECVVLHGASTHGEDLVSELDAARVAEAAASLLGEALCEGRALGLGASSDGVTRAIALALESGWSLVFVERLNGGMEDVPLQLAEEVGDRVVLVDLHNSFDDPRPSPSPGDAVGRSIIANARAAIEVARTNACSGWSAGIASAQGKWNEEVGSAGVSVLALTRENCSLLVAVYDANNALRSFRDRFYELAAGSCAIVLLATSDTHELTGSRAGSTYRPLGFETRPDNAWALVVELHRRVLQNSHTLLYRLRRFYVEASFLDPQKLEYLSKCANRLLARLLLLTALLTLIFLAPLLA